MRGLFTKRSAAGMALLAVLACAPGASASITYNTPVGSNTEWDNNTNFPVSASAVFTMSAGFFTVTLTNFTGDTFYNSQNLSGITFNLDNGGPALTNVASSTVTNGSVAVVNPGGGSTTASGTPLAANTAVSTSNASVSWFLENLLTNGSFGQATTSGVNGSGNENVGQNAYVFATAGSSTYNGVNSIVGSGNALGQFDGINPVGSCPSNNCNSGNPIVGSYFGTAQATQQMIFHTVTFTITNASVTTNTNVSNVFFMFGPDGPDADDMVGGQLVSSVPEPASFVLGATGLFLILALRLWHSGFRFSAVSETPFQSALMVEAFAPASSESTSVSRMAKLSRFAARFKRGSSHDRTT